MKKWNQLLLPKQLALIVVLVVCIAGFAATLFLLGHSQDIRQQAFYNGTGTQCKDSDGVSYRNGDTFCVNDKKRMYCNLDRLITTDCSQNEVCQEGKCVLNSSSRLEPCRPGAYQFQVPGMTPCAYSLGDGKFANGSQCPAGQVMSLEGQKVVCKEQKYLNCGNVKQDSFVCGNKKVMQCVKGELILYQDCQGLDCHNNTCDLTPRCQGLMSGNPIEGGSRCFKEMEGNKIYGYECPKGTTELNQKCQPDKEAGCGAIKLNNLTCVNGQQVRCVGNNKFQLEKDCKAYGLGCSNNDCDEVKPCQGQYIQQAVPGMRRCSFEYRGSHFIGADCPEGTEVDYNTYTCKKKK